MTDREVEDRVDLEIAHIGALRVLFRTSERFGNAIRQRRESNAAYHAKLIPRTDGLVHTVRAKTYEPVRRDLTGEGREKSTGIDLVRVAYRDDARAAITTVYPFRSWSPLFAAAQVVGRLARGHREVTVRDDITAFGLVGLFEAIEHPASGVGLSDHSANNVRAAQSWLIEQAHRFDIDLLDLASCAFSGLRDNSALPFRPRSTIPRAFI